MGCGKSKHSVVGGALRKGESMDADSKNRIEVRFEPFPDVTVKAMAQEEAEDGDNLKQEIGGKHDDVNVEALPHPEEATESQKMSLLPRKEGTEHEELGQKEQQEVEKKDETLEEEKTATLEENKDASSGDEHRDGNEGLAGRLISCDSPDHHFSSRKDDEALQGVLSEYNSSLHVDANKPTQEVLVNGVLKTKEPAVAVVPEPMISAVEPKVLTADGDQTNPATNA